MFINFFLFAFKNILNIHFIINSLIIIILTNDLNVNLNHKN